MRERHGIFVDGSAPVDRTTRGAVRLRLRRHRQPHLLVVAGRGRHVAGRRHRPRRSRRAPAVRGAELRADQAAVGPQRWRPGPHQGLGAGQPRHRQLRPPAGGEHLRVAGRLRCPWPRWSTTASGRCATRSTRGRRPSTTRRWSSPPTRAPTCPSPPNGTRTVVSPATGPARPRSPGRRSSSGPRSTSTSPPGTSRPTRCSGRCSATGPSPTRTCRRTASTRWCSAITGRWDARATGGSRSGRGGRRPGGPTTRPATPPTG